MTKSIFVFMTADIPWKWIPTNNSF